MMSFFNIKIIMGDATSETSNLSLLRALAERLVVAASCNVFAECFQDAHSLSFSRL